MFACGFDYVCLCEWVFVVFCVCLRVCVYDVELSHFCFFPLNLHVCKGCELWRPPGSMTRMWIQEGEDLRRSSPTCVKANYHFSLHSLVGSMPDEVPVQSMWNRTSLGTQGQRPGWFICWESFCWEFSHGMLLWKYQYTVPLLFDKMSFQFSVWSHSHRQNKPLQLWGWIWECLCNWS